MGKQVLAALLGGLLVLGVSTAFAEEPQVSPQDVVKAQLNAQTKVKQFSDTTTPEGTTEGPQLLTDEELDKVNAAGFGFAYHVGVKAIMFGLQAVHEVLNTSQE